MRAPAVEVTARVHQQKRAAELLRRALRLILQLLWFGVIPALLSGIAWRYFVPHSSTAVGFEGAFASFARERSLLLTLLVFVALSSVLRYWRNWLPGGRFLLEPLGRPIARESSIKSSIVFFAWLGAVVLLALQMRTRFLQAYDVMGSSMLPTLTPGQVLAGSVAAYGPGRLPRRGDVVVLKTLVDGVPRDVVKRVIGLPGDRVSMNGVHPIINGWPVPLCEAGAYYNPNDDIVQDADPSGLLVMEFLEGEAYLTLQTKVAPPVTDYVVKPDEIYVLGDNRSSSRDSRSFDRGAPHGFPLADVKASVARTLFRPTARGDIDLRIALKPLGPSVHLDGADTSGIQGRISGCLAIRPKATTPPQAPNTALARQP